MLNEKILNYKLTRLIGKGGMAEVFEAQHEKFENRKVAVKILNPIFTANDIIRKRFENEAKIMANLEHANIVKVVDLDERPDRLAILMELLEGENLSQFMKRHKKLNLPEIISIYSQALDAFGYAHENKIVHRDVKPSNIFIEQNNTVKILDFGIAKILSGDSSMTTTGIQMGTLKYMSPEQVKDSKYIDHKSDIYSLGVILHYMLAGKEPYQDNTLTDYDIRKNIVEQTLPRLQSNNQFQAIIDKSTQKNAANRFDSCEQFKQELLAVYEGDDKTIIEEPIFNKAKEPIIAKPKPTPKPKKEKKPKEPRAPRKKLSTKAKKIMTYGIASVAVLLLAFASFKFFSGGVDYVPVSDTNGLVGFADKDGNLVIDYAFYDANEFKEGMAVVNFFGKYGYINSEGKLITEYEYDEAADFSEGRALVKKNGKYGYISDKGSLIIGFDYFNAKSFSDGLALIEKDGKYGYINKKGELVINNEFDYAMSFSEGLAVATSEDGLFGYINTDGEWEINPEFSYAERFSEGRAVTAKDGLMGYINDNGELMGEYAYEMAYPYSNEIALVLKDQKYGFINTSGEYVAEPQFDEASSFYKKENVAVVINKGKKAVLNADGELITDWYTNVQVKDYGILKVENNGQFAVFNLEGEIISDWYDEIGKIKEGITKVRQQNKYGFIRITGEEFIAPIYMQVADFQNGFASVKQNDYFQIINMDGELLTDEQFDDAGSFSNNRIRVKKEEKWAYLDPSGMIVVDYQYDDAADFMGEYAGIEQDKKYGLIDVNGNLLGGLEEGNDLYNLMYAINYAVLEADEKTLFIFQSGTVEQKEGNISKFDGLNFIFKKENKYALADKKGQMLSGFDYEEIDDFEEGMAMVKKDDKVNFIDRDGHVISTTWYKDAEEFTEGYALIAGDDDKIGYLSAEGQPFLFGQYDDIDEFSNGLAVVENEDSDEALINRSGQVQGAWYDGVSLLGKGMARVKKDDKYAVMTRSGNLISGFDYDNIGSYNYGLAKIKKQDNYGYMNRELQEVTSPIYEYVYDFSDGYGRVQQNDKYGTVNRIGKIVISPQYSSFSAYSWYNIVKNNDDKYTYILNNGKQIGSWFDEAKSFDLDIARVKKDSKWALLNGEGNEISSWYDEISSFSEGFAYVKSNDLYGYIDRTGDVKIQVQYSDAEEFDDGIALVENNDKEAYINQQGDLVLGWYDEISTSNGLYKVKENDKYAYYTINGESITEWYTYLGSFYYGLAYAKKGEYYGYINTSGTEVIQFSYQDAWSFSYGMAKVKNNDKYALINTKGETISKWYDYLSIKGKDKIQVREGDSYGIINSNDKIIVPISYDEIDVEGEYFVVKDESEEEVLVFNSKGTKIISGLTIPEKSWSYDSSDEVYSCNFYAWKKGKRGFLLATTDVEMTKSDDNYLVLEWKHKYDKSYPTDGFGVYIYNNATDSYDVIWDKEKQELNSEDYYSERISLSEYSGSVGIILVGFSGYGQNLYVRNVRLEINGKKKAAEMILL